MIRQANKFDIAYILDLLKSYSDNTHIDKEYIKNDMGNSYSKYLVYKLDNIVVGFINYHKFEEYGEIIDIVVDENYRRKHIATSLLESALNDLSNCDVTLEVREENKAAIRLYGNFEFKIIGTRKNYYNDENAYMMKKESK